MKKEFIKVVKHFYTWVKYNNIDLKIIPKKMQNKREKYLIKKHKSKLFFKSLIACNIYKMTHNNLYFINYIYCLKTGFYNNYFIFVDAEGGIFISNSIPKE